MRLSLLSPKPKQEGKVTEIWRDTGHSKGQPFDQDIMRTCRNNPTYSESTVSSIRGQQICRILQFCLPSVKSTSKTLRTLHQPQHDLRFRRHNDTLQASDRYLPCEGNKYACQPQVNDENSPHTSTTHSAGKDFVDTTSLRQTVGIHHARATSMPGSASPSQILQRLSCTAARSSQTCNGREEHI